MAGLTLPITVSVELLVTGLQLPGLQTLSFRQSEAFLTGVAVIIAWPPTGTTGPMTWLTVLALLIHKEARLTVVHTVPVRHIEALLTPVALCLVTVLAVFILTLDTLPGVLHAISPLWTGLVTE